jgi:hypothetical protein
VGSVDEVVARITGADDRGAEGEKERRVRIIARIRVGGGMMRTLPSEEELKRIKGEPYVSETIRRSMERVGATIREVGSEGEVEVDG